MREGFISDQIIIPGEFEELSYLLNLNGYSLGRANNKVVLALTSFLLFCISYVVITTVLPFFFAELSLAEPLPVSFGGAFFFFFSSIAVQTSGSGISFLLAVKQIYTYEPSSPLVHTPTLPLQYEPGKGFIKMHLRRHENQMTNISYYLEELSFHRIEKMRERFINDQIIIPGEFDEHSEDIQCAGFDHDHYQEAACAYHEEHMMHDCVQLDHVVDSHDEYTHDSNIIMCDQYVRDNEVPVVHSGASSVPTDAFMMIHDDIFLVAFCFQLFAKETALRFASAFGLCVLLIEDSLTF
nr:hypothetical protein [Tanacetum cinerariifolium]